MKLESIVTLANSNTELEFLAMERSLRATGSTLPIKVIPYDAKTFSLPKGSTWWELPEITGWLKSAHPCFRKYQCLVLENYQFVDTDVIFLMNPEKKLEALSGFITSCGHWRDTSHTVTEESKKIFKSKSTLWEKFVFNTGQFACDTKLYEAEALKELALSRQVTFTKHHHEQPGINLLVFESGVKITNLTLPPYNLESTWAGDYSSEFESYWKNLETKPYLMHWAGLKITGERPIDQLFLNFLTNNEKKDFLQKKSSFVQKLFGPSK